MRMRLFLSGLLLMISLSLSLAQENYKVTSQGDTAYTFITIKKVNKDRSVGDSLKNLTYREVLREVYRLTFRKKRLFQKRYVETPVLQTEQQRLERVLSRDLDTSYFDLQQKNVQQYLGEWILQIRTDTGMVADRVEVSLNQNNVIRVKTLENGTSEIVPGGTFRGSLRLHTNDWLELNSNNLEEEVWLMSFGLTNRELHDKDLRAYESIEGLKVALRQRTIAEIEEDE